MSNKSFKKIDKNIKLLLTSAGLDGGLEIRNELLCLIEKNISSAKVFLINTANEKSDDWKWVKFIVSQLENIGFVSQNITIFSLDKKIDRGDLKNVDLVYVCGGNTFLYLDGIRKTGLDQEIENFVKRGGVYFGVSAGSIIVSPTIEIAGWEFADENTINLQNLEALNIVPFFVYPHFEEKYLSVVKNNSLNMKNPVITINDNQAVLVKNGNIKIIGKEIIQR